MIAYSEAEAKELRAVALCLEGRHALHGVGHHANGPRAHLPAAPWVHQIKIPASHITVTTNIDIRQHLGYHDHSPASHVAKCNNAALAFFLREHGYVMTLSLVEGSAFKTDRKQ